MYIHKINLTFIKTNTNDKCKNDKIQKFYILSDFLNYFQTMKCVPKRSDANDH